ncbi:MAG: HAD family hydrolase [Anaerolineales bacterium]|nr:HAD family hydrolase [Anaerolineales bacterium]
MSGKIKAVIFDLGNTLVYFHSDRQVIYQLADRALLGALKENHISIDEDMFLEKFPAFMRECFKRRNETLIESPSEVILSDFLDQNHIPYAPEIISKSLRRMYAITQAHWLPSEDTHITLKQLKEEGYRMGIISNAANDDDVHQIVRNTSINNHFDFIISSAVVGVRKPDERIFHTSQRFWDYKWEEIAMVGDTLRADILGGNNMGMYSVWITRLSDTPQNRADRDKIKPDVTIRTLAELPSVLAVAS